MTIDTLPLSEAISEYMIKDLLGKINTCSFRTHEKEKAKIKRRNQAYLDGVKILVKGFPSLKHWEGSIENIYKPTYGLD